MLLLASTKPITPVRGPSLSIGPKVGTPSYWYENGVLWLVSPNSTVAPQPLGFANYAALTQFGNTSGVTLVTNSLAPIYTTWSPQDFPVLLAGPGAYIFATQYSAPFGAGFLYDLFTVTGGQAIAAGALGTILPWTQAASLSVQGSSGPSTISLTYQALCRASDAKNGIVTAWF